MRAQDEEERLARILLCAAWYAVHFRNPFAFPYTPLFNAAAEQGHRLTWERMLQIPTQDLVDDLLAQLDAAEDSPLERLRLGCIPHDCAPGPTFDGSRDVTADADLIVDGTLIDFKSARHLRNFPKTTIYQLLSYTLLDYSDHHRIDSVGVYMTRGSALVTWPIEDYLALLGTRRRDLIELRAVFQRLLSEPDWHADQEPFDPVQHESVRKVLDGFFADPPPPGCCHVCAQPIAAASQRRRYCSQHCSNRSDYYQRRGWL
jgi:hypothetical protein